MPLPASTPDLFTVRQALDDGVSPHELRRRAELVRPTSGVRARRDRYEGTLREQCAAVALALPEAAAFSHTTALRLLGVELPWRLETDEAIHVVVPRRVQRPKRHDVVAHACLQRSLETVERGGVRVTSPAQTWLHVAHLLLPDDVVVLGDSLVRRGDPCTDLAELSRLVAATRGMRGLERCRRALDLVRPGTDSSMETRMRLVLVEGGVVGLVVNAVVHDRHGKYLCRPDLTIPELRIAIEYDGDVHRTDRETWRRDIEKRQRMQDEGWVVVTVTADDVIRHPARLAHRVRGLIATRRRRPAL